MVSKTATEIPKGCSRAACRTILPGFTDTAFSERLKSPKLKEELQKAGQKFAMSPEAVARAVAYVLEQPEDVNIGEVTLRAKAQP